MAENYSGPCQVAVENYCFAATTIFVNFTCKDRCFLAGCCCFNIITGCYRHFKRFVGFSVRLHHSYYNNCFGLNR